MLGQAAPAFPARLAEQHPGAGIAGLALDEKAVDVGGVFEAIALAPQQVHRDQRRQQPFRIQRLDLERRGNSFDRIVTGVDGGEQVKLDGAHERRRLPEGFADPLQADRVRTWL